MSIKEALDRLQGLEYHRGRSNEEGTEYDSSYDADIAAAEAVVLALYEQQGLELVRQKKLRLDAAKIAAEARTRLTIYRSWAEDKLNKQKAIADELAGALEGMGDPCNDCSKAGTCADDPCECKQSWDAALAAYNKAKEG